MAEEISIISIGNTEEIESEKQTIPPIYKEIFFIDNGSQSNIYCSSILRYPSTTQERFLVGTLRGKVSCLERQEDHLAKELFHSSHDMQAREVYFSYIPGDAEIISMDAFYKHQTVSGNKCLIVGVTIIIKTPGDASNLYFFNIYNALEPGSEFDLDKLAQVCQHQSLGFIPYQLSHADVYIDGDYETVFLLAGSDQQIHVFCGDNKQNFEEHPCKKYFPELVDLPGLVIWMHIMNCAEFKRLAAVGCDNGWVRVCLTCVKDTKVISTWSLSMNGPVSSVRFFTLKQQEEEMVAPKETDLGDCFVSPRIKLYQVEDMNLLVTSCLEISVVFLNISEKGLEDKVILNQSDQYDSVTCCCVADIDFDGNNEILLGTYGQEFLVYKWHAPENGLGHLIHFELVWKKEFSKPLLSIHGLDLMNDGVQELVVVSLTGVHILQYEVDQAADVLLGKLKRLFPDQRTVSNYIKKHSHENEAGSDSELEDVINAICATKNSYNEVT